MKQSLSDEVEAARIAAVRRYDILDTPPDGTFDRLTALAARFFDVPISIVSIVDSDRIWFKSHHGLAAAEIGREPGLCASAILQKAPWVVENARLDPRALANPLVAGEFGLGFYAGVPLTTSDGHNLGTFCIIDQEPRTVGEEALGALRDLAAVVMDQLELRLAARRAVWQEQELRDQAENMAHRLQRSLLPPQLPDVPGADVAVRWAPAGGGVGGDFYDLFGSGENVWTVVVGDVCGKGIEAAAVTALARYTLRAASLQTDVPREALQLLNDALLRQRPGDERFVTAVYVIARVMAGGIGLSLSSAGHVPPLLRRADGTVEVLASAGMPLGLFNDPSPSGAEAELRRGDALFLYTDGVTEARRGPDEFALDRLQATVARTVGMSAERSAALIEDEVTGFREGRAADDTALLVLAVP
ncbi:MAG: SpoIIE family protein phosphatase [Euzebyaceae bacterium]|jgi:sigma-B regulation protein RsbU (phosphoserine phosphatase)|nr:SpoIIE family protein phosphatase [Euzebyaceae bacterium]